MATSSTLLLEEEEEERFGLKYNSLSDAKFFFAFGVAVFSASLSIYGSLSAMFLICRNRKLKELYHRLIFGLSVSDLILSLTVIVQFFLARRDLGYPIARGTVKTCDAVGFLFQYYISSSIYNAELSLYFVAKVRYNMTDRQFSKRFEPYLHIFPFLIPTIFGIIGIAFSLFNPSFTLRVCDFWVYPADCTIRDDVPCERTNTNVIIVVGYVVLAVYGLSAVIGVGGTWVVYRTVKKQLRVMESYSFDASVHAQRHERRNRAIMVQAVLYTAAFLNGFLIVLLATVSTAPVLEKALIDPTVLGDSWWYYLTLVMCYFLFPIQGFFNWIIYIRIRLNRIRQKNSHRSWWWAYNRLFLASGVAPSNQSGSIPRLVTSLQPQQQANQPREFGSPSSDMNDSTSWGQADGEVDSLGDDSFYDFEEEEQDGKTAQYSDHLACEDISQENNILADPNKNDANDSDCKRLPHAGHEK